MNLAAGEIPDKPCFNRSEKKLAFLGSLSCALNIVEDPFDLCSRKICVYKQSRMLTDIVAESLVLELFAKLGGTAALPYNSVIYRLARILIPDNRSFSLICNSYAGDLFNVKIARIDNRRDGVHLAVKNIHRIMLNPARFGIDLIKFILCFGNNASALVKNYSSGAGCSLVKC